MREREFPHHEPPSAENQQAAEESLEGFRREKRANQNKNILKQQAIQHDPNIHRDQAVQVDHNSENKINEAKALEKKKKSSLKVKFLKKWDTEDPQDPQNK